MQMIFKKNKRSLKDNFNATNGINLYSKEKVFSLEM